MCLTIDTDFHSRCLPRAFVANEDLKVYKLAYKDTTKKTVYRTAFTFLKFHLKENGVCTLESNINKRWNDRFDKTGYWTVDEGIHAYYLEWAAQERARNIFRYVDNEKVLLEAYIPKGSEFYIGTWGEIVSDKLVILGPEVKKEITPASTVIDNLIIE